MGVFQYRAEQYDGSPATGTLDAADTGSAERQLTSMGLRVLDITPTSSPVKPVRLGADDLRTFNEFLLQISRAGVPVERGLAMLAGELRTSRLKQSIDALVADLEAGRPLEAAIAQRRDTFPPLYGKLIDAGIQSADLPGILTQFGRHMDDMTELRDSIWRALAYPVVVLVALLGLMSFLGYWLLPRYFAALSAMTWRLIERSSKFSFSYSEVIVHMRVPPSALVLLLAGKLAPFLLLLLAIAAAAGWWVSRSARAGRGDRRWVDRIVLRLPVVGRAVRDSYLASWLDVLSIGTGAGLDLPRSLRLASEAVDLPSLRDDSEAICQRLERGQEIGSLTLKRLAATIPLAIDVATTQSNLPRTFAALAEQHRENAERQIRLIPGRIMPVLLICIGLLAGGVMYSLWVPMAELLKFMGLGS